ncbi:LEA type 2 family protein [Pseudomonas azerbaijanorientalis]|jgi:LEA14-like dessication related protein|uniref:LEA type 2 family protein n=1 Tax=Pseudomonas azerbaijanorientalis TaxID=2842350 RepID=UPI001C3D0791|nr:LEA type 2 family protein [Pseudomonas azerbaijanorientalis]QXH59564.1 LEA type 2 family protein [Pseudomonas azerbaijanorientalis]
MRSVHAVLISLLLCLSACSSLPNRDPLKINVVGIEPLQGEGMEVRFAVTIRVQNPNDYNLTYSGVALDLDINGQPFASGVSDQRGEIGRFSDTVVSVPVSVSAFSFIRQTYGISQMKTLNNMPYILRGKLSGGVFNTKRFVDSGTLNLPGSTTGSR